MTSNTGLSPKGPNNYVGPNVYLATVVTRNRAPTGADYRQPETGKLYPLDTYWIVGKDPTTGTFGDLWYLATIIANVASWKMLSSGSSGPTIGFVVPNGSSPVFPTGAGLVTYTSTGGTITMTGSPNTINFDIRGITIGSINIQTITSTGTYTPTAGMVYCQIQILGGGAAGGGAPATAANECAAGGGGGAGEYAVGIFSAATIGASKAVTIGAGGVGSTGDGASGGNSSVGALISALGGAGGQAGIAEDLCIATNGGSGGTGGTGGSYRTPGTSGQLGIVTLISTGYISVGGIGAPTQVGSGGHPTVGGGQPGVGYGAGGAGSSNIPSTVAATNGGNGSAGIVIITEYIRS